MTDSLASYDELVNKAMEDSNIGKNIKPLETFERLYAYFKIGKSTTKMTYHEMQQILGIK